MAKTFNTTDDIQTGNSAVDSLLNGTTPDTTGKAKKGKAKKEIKEVRTSIVITKTMHEDVKVLAAALGITKNQAIERAIQAALDENAAAIEKQRAIWKTFKE